MFNIGGGEFLVIALIALIVLGPQRLPDAARQVGKAMGELRRLSSGFQNELKDAFADAEQPVAPPTPRRDALASSADVSSPVAAAVSAVSGQAPARRTPLKAASPTRKTPLKAAPPPNGVAPTHASPAKRSSAPAAGAASKTTPPRTKGR